MIRVYVAAPLAWHARAGNVARWLLTQGFAVVSAWHNSPGACDPDDEATRALLLAANLEDLARAQVLLALTDKGTPRATLVEMGFALGQGKPVVWLHGPAREGRNLFDAHRKVRRITALEDAPPALELAVGAGMDPDERPTVPVPPMEPEGEGDAP